MVKDRRLKRFMERLYCDKCEDEMVITEETFNGKKKTVNYKYECKECNTSEVHSIKYPRIVEKEVEEYLVYNDG